MPRVERRAADYEREILDFIGRAIREPRDALELASSERWISFVESLRGVPFDEEQPGNQAFFLAVQDYALGQLERAGFRLETVITREGVERPVARETQTGRFASFARVWETLRGFIQIFFIR